VAKRSEGGGSRVAYVCTGVIERSNERFNGAAIAKRSSASDARMYPDDGGLLASMSFDALCQTAGEGETAQCARCPTSANWRA
jgi:hypothetical protein